MNVNTYFGAELRSDPQGVGWAERSKSMRIDTNIQADSEDGKKGFISCQSAEELLKVMTLEHAEECEVTTVWMGQEVTSKVMTIKDVSDWVELNQRISTSH